MEAQFRWAGQPTGSSSKSDSMSPGCCVFTLGKQGKEMVPVSSFVPGGVPNDSVSLGHALRLANNFFYCMLQAPFKLQLLSCISVGHLLCCFFEDGESVSSGPSGSPRTTLLNS